MCFLNRLSRAVRPLGPQGHTGYRTLLEDFLSGSGILSEVLYSEVEHTFNAITDLAGISTPEFRPKMFVWATTGSPFIGADPQPIVV